MTRTFDAVTDINAAVVIVVLWSAFGALFWPFIVAVKLWGLL